MRFSPTSGYLALARGAAKTYRWEVSIKKTTSLSDSLSSGTWVDVTSRIPAIPDQPSQIEWEIGEYSANGIQFEAKGIAWWKANIFNASASQNLELKIKFTLGDASDTVYTYSGWIDKVGVAYNELADTVSFKAYTAQELGDRLAGESITTQYVDTDVDGTGLAGLFLFDIPNMYVVDVDISSFEMKIGVHTIEYDYNGGSYQASLDGGAAVALTADNDSYILGNGPTSDFDTERVEIYVKNRTALPTTSVQEKIVVTESGETLPTQWYRFLSAERMLTILFGEIGITTLTFDDMDMESYDGGYRLSFIEAPPNDVTVLGKKWAVATNGTDLYIAIGNVIYLRTMSTGTYAVLATLGSTEKISKMVYNARNDHLWILHGTNANGNGKVSRFDFIPFATLQSPQTLSTLLDDIWHNSVEVFDFEYTAGSWKYGLVFTHRQGTTQNGELMFFDGAAAWPSGGFVATPFTGVGFGYTAGGTGIFSYFMHQMPGGLIRFRCINDTGLGQNCYREITVDSGGFWVTNGEFMVNTPHYTYGAYNESDDRIVYYGAVNSAIESTDTTSSTETIHLILDRRDWFSEPHNFLYAPTTHDAVFVTTWGYYSVNGVDTRVAYMYKITGTDPAELAGEFGAYTDFTAMTQIGSIVYGVDVMGRLFQYHTRSQFYVKTGDFEGKSVREALNGILQAFNLVAIISSAKEARIYRRGDDDGVPATSGNSIDLTIKDPSDLTEVYSYLTKVAYVEVTNGVTTYSYDGTTFNARVLGNTRSVTINNPYIPDGIIQDLAYRLYQYFSRDWTMYEIPLDNVPLYQFEPFDGATLSFPLTKIGVDTSGYIVGVTIHEKASMTVRAIVGSGIVPY